MSQTCYYHPVKEITSTCNECGVPLCAECTHRIDGVAACEQCAPKVQTQSRNNSPFIAAYAASSPSSDAQTESVKTEPPPYIPFYALGAPDGTINSFGVRTIPPGSAPLGLMIGAFAGTVASILALKILLHLGGIFYGFFIAIGYLIAVTVKRVSRQNGPGLASASVGVMISALLIAHLIFVQDVLNEVRASGHAAPGLTLLDVFSEVMGAMPGIYWIFILGSLAFCWRTVKR